jgi:N-acetylmuramoyl-L-alanine amidase
MIAALFALALAAGTVPADAAGPSVITVVRLDGEVKIPVRVDAAGVPMLPAPTLLAALNGSVRMRDDGWAEIVLAKQTFLFLVGAPLYIFSDRLRPLAAPSAIANDTLYLPFQFVAEIVPYYLGERYEYDEETARLVDRGSARPKPAVKHLSNGLRPGHVVAVDAGHGGVDPGNPGLYFPQGVREKDVTLQVSQLLREELQRRGIGVRMTRTTDTLIALGDRGGYCTDSCDLFVSLHVNSLPRRAGYTGVSGFETYFLAEAKTEDAVRVARMENDAVRFESGDGANAAGGGLDFIIKDLQLNEHLRESARVAELVQQKLSDVHTGGDRGVKQAGFMVLTTARRPAVLVEMGYSTNPSDGRLLTRRSSQRALAVAIADAVVAYLLEYERKTHP